MKFRVLDIFVLTTLLACLVGAFRVDSIFGGEILILASVLLTAGVASYRFGRTPIRAGAIGGLVGGAIGGLVSAGIAYGFNGDTFFATPGYWRNGPPDWDEFLWQLPAALLLGGFFGSVSGTAIGPMVALQWRERSSRQPDGPPTGLSRRQRKLFKLSWLMLGGVVLLSFMEMLDRTTMGSIRNWAPVRAGLALVFFVFTIRWLLERRQLALASAVSVVPIVTPPKKAGKSASLWLGVIAGLTFVFDCPTPASGAQPQDSASPPARPNIVFIFSDDHALNSISAYGGRLENIAPTPNIDRLAREGALFRNSFCANSICGPSRACILTGKHSHINGFMRNGNNFDSSQWTFVKDLQSAGYSTAVVGKWHLKSDPVGFDFWEVLPGQGNYYNPDFIRMDGTRKRERGYCTDLVTDKALNWLQQRDRSKPFLLMCQHKAPHRTFSPALRHLDDFDGVTIPEPETLFDDYANRSKTLRANEMSLASHFDWMYDLKLRKDEHEGIKLPGPDRYPAIEYRRMDPQQKSAWDAHFGPQNEAFLADFQAGKISDKDLVRWKYQRYMKNYLGTVKSVDESVGRLLDYLDQEQLSDNTIVIYSSDQGFYLGEHGWYDKRWMFEESLKMPFVVRWPGVIKAGSEPDDLIQNIDYAPTFLEAAGLDVPAAVQGRSMLPIFRNQDDRDRRQAIYYAYYEVGEHNVPQHFGVRSMTHKLMYFPATNEWNMFDLSKDPQETVDVYQDSSQRQFRDQLSKTFEELRRQFGAPEIK